MKTSVPFLVALACMLALRAPAQEPPLFEDRVIARGNGFEVKKSQLDEAFVAFKASAVANRRPIPESARDLVESNLLDRLIVSQILLKRATEADRAEGKKKSEEFIKEIKSRIASEQLFSAQLKAMGISPEKFEARALEDAICEQVLEREVKAQIQIPEETAKQYYEENLQQFEQPELVKGMHILLMSRDPKTLEDYSSAEKLARREAIEKLRIRAKAGEDFAKLAREFSEHPAAKTSNGEFTIPRGGREPELEAAAFALSPNQISDVVVSPYGYHVLKITERIPAKRLEFAEVSKDIREILALREVKKRLPEYFEKLKKEAGTEILVNK